MKEVNMNERAMLNPDFREGYQEGYRDALREVSKRLEMKNQDYMKGVHYDLSKNSESKNVTA
tara:strand:+ start:286 stop:471 length:186 start_codon:yes stop_codon:yes gene_type:complete